MEQISALSIIAGRGDLPVRVAEAAAAAGTKVHILALKGFADHPGLDAYPRDTISMGEAGKIFKAIKRASSTHVCMAGGIERPDIKSMKMDFEAARHVPKILRAAAKGDGALLDLVRDVLKSKGLKIISPSKIVVDIKTDDGDFGQHKPDAAAMADIAKGVAVARALGAQDVAQGAVVCDGLVLAVEAAEGTDAMLGRIPELPAELRGHPNVLRGVLVKVTKPVQDKRLDQPTIGPRTIENAHKAGLSGIAIEAEHGLIMDRAETIALADKLGLFIYGVNIADYERS